KKVCEHFEINYSDSMINQKSTISDAFQSVVNPGEFEFKDFHEGLKGDLNRNKIGAFKSKFTLGQVVKISTVTNSFANDFGYKFDSNEVGVLNIWDRIKIFWTRVRKWGVLRFYNSLPFQVKLYLGKRRNRL